MLSKSKRILFGMLHVVMLLVMVHWFLISVTYLRRDFMVIHFRCWIAISASLAETRWGKETFAWLTRHKKASCLDDYLSVNRYGLCGALYPSGCCGCFQGAFDLLKQSSITNYLSRNPNNIPLFLYEKFFYVLFGSSGLWVMQALNILYVNLGAVLLYKLSQKHFNQKQLI